MDAGGLVGLSFPGRVGARALITNAPDDSGRFGELRAGVDLGTGGRVEPTLELVVGLRLR